MDKALASGAGDCGFESHRDRVDIIRFSFFFSRLCFFWRNFARSLLVSIKMAKTISICFPFFFQYGYRSDSQFVNITLFSLIKTRLLFVSGQL